MTKMRIEHTFKPATFKYLPDDETEPEIGTVVEVEEALGLALIVRGWGVDADGKVLVNRNNGWRHEAREAWLDGDPKKADEIALENGYRLEGNLFVPIDKQGLALREPVKRRRRKNKLKAKEMAPPPTKKIILPAKKPDPFSDIKPSDLLADDGPFGKEK